MAKHYLTIKFKVWDIWFDLEKEIIHIIMEIGNKLILLEREF